MGFLSTIGCADKIEYVVDINPYLQGKFIPGLGLEIKAPEFLKEYMPDLVIVMNPVYRDEIQQMLNDMRINTKVMCV